MKTIPALAASAVILLFTVRASAEEMTADVVVVEATPGGIAMAVRAAREGLRVLLVNHTQHLGGILSSGLGVWDTQYEGHRAPIYDEVRQAFFEHYRNAYGADSPQHRDALPGKSGYTNGRFEPRVAEKVLTELVARERRITVLKPFYPVDLARDGARITAMTFRELGGARIVRATAAIFADCSYEGDVLPLAKAPYRVGREARGEYQEPHAGVIFMHPSAKAPTPEAAEKAKLHDALRLRKFSGFQELLPASSGAADAAVQACNYRTILTTNPANRVGIDKPANYDAYFLKSLEIFSGVDSIPNGKFGWNRPQLVGQQTAYVEADWPTRQRIMDEHWEMTLGLLYFLQNDLTVPEIVRRAWKEYGLAKDEFVDHGHRPYEMYVREARRLVGRAVYTEHDVTLLPGLRRAPMHADAVAVTEWYLDSHSCTTARVPGGLEEGKMMLHQETFPGQIPYRCLLPRELDNLLAPVCLSATHVAWGTVRLEPVFMQTGEAAGLAAALAHKCKIAPARLDPDRLVRELCRRRSMLSFFNDVDVASSAPWAPAAEYFGTQGFFHDYNARAEQPLKRATAEVWLEGLARLRRGKPDPCPLSLAVARAEGSDSPAMPRGEFLAHLPQVAQAGAALSGPAILRGEALLLMWQSLAGPPDAPK